ncbi:hypothetical protein LTR94_008904 [Friedmanniomyces endolithicus]|nr:hypothetical protein LTR94_008904 [Friedmanniomyces endolithicus]
MRRRSRALLLHRRGLHRGIDPLAILVDLAAGGHAQRVGAQILVQDRHGDLHPLTGRVGIGIPVGDDDAAVGIGLHHRHEGQRVQAGAPQIGVDADGGDLRRGQIGLGPFLRAAPACGKRQERSQQKTGGKGNGKATDHQACPSLKKTKNAPLL